MIKEKQTPQQDFADGFAGYAKTITEKLNNFVYRRDDPEIAQLYITWRQVIASLIKIMSESIKNRPSLPELPTLIENNYYAGLTRLAEYCEKAAREIVRKKEGLPKAKSRTKNEKIALIADKLDKNPNATSVEIEKATGIDESGVRQLWKPIKKMYQRKTRRGSKIEGTIEAIDPSASCSICRVPLSKPFECSLCKEIISGECKDCHYTNTHPKDAIP